MAITNPNETTLRKYTDHTIAHPLLRIILAGLLLVGYIAPLKAQFYNGSKVSFGKNRIQHQQQNWQYFRTNQFDVYFYPTGKELGQYTLTKAPEVIEEIEKLLNYSSSKKIQFIVYNTQADFRESNFAYDNDDFYNQGGVTNIYGTKIYLYFDGNHAHFDKMLRAGIMNLYAHFIINGTSVGANISSETLIHIPNWYFSGLGSYFGEAWNPTIDYHVKNGIISQKYADFDELSPVDATYAGHSLWKYIADTYGREAIPTILYATRTNRSIERGFYQVTGVPYKQLLLNWYRHYYVLYKNDNKRDLPPDLGIAAKKAKNKVYQQFRIAPDGEHYAFVTNEAGKVKVWLQHEGEKRPRCIFRKFHKTEENPDLSFPLIAWHPNSTMLGFTLEDKGRCYYYPYLLSNKKPEPRLLIDVEKITDLSISEDGKYLLFSGFLKGQSDIFIYSMRARAFENLTQDFYDDYAPRFFNNQKQIIFSSNRPDNRLHPKERFTDLQPQKHYDLFMYDFEKRDTTLLQITYTPEADEQHARPIDRDKLTYLSDENGITNRYTAIFDSTISTIDTIIHYAYYAQNAATTDRAYHIIEQDYSPTRAEVGEILLYKDAYRLYRFPYTDTLSQDTLTHSAMKVKDRMIQRHYDSIAENKKEVQYNYKRGFYQVRKSDLSRSGIPDALRLTKQDSIDINNIATRNYYTQFTINQLVTQADLGFLNTSYQQFSGGSSPIYLNSGINALFMVGIQDLFEDYRINGGFRFSLDLSSNEFMLSYEDLHRRTDHQVALYRQSIKSVIHNYMYKQRSNSIFYIIKFPFDKFNSLRLTLTGRYETSTLASLNDYSLQAPDERHGWAAIKGAYIFDSSKEMYTNLWRGSKVKVFAEYQHRIDRENKHLIVVGFDARKSIKVYRNMTWATRIAASTNFGTSRLVYYMGGMDNWFLAKFDESILVDPEKEYHYQTLATNMRGFKQNIRNGTSFVLLSTELRIPFVQLIARRHVSNEFFNSMQLLCFGDFGTAWTGTTPYSQENCLYTRYVQAGNISVRVKRQVEPFIGGFGVGLRASLFGYFLRMDYAWGVEDYKIIDPRGTLYLSIGLDF